MNVKIEITADGSPTLYMPEMDEHYHSVKGALAESLHIYLDLGWRYAGKDKEVVKVFEVGYGTGLNAALTAYQALEDRKFTIYHSVELYPLDRPVYQSLAKEIEDPYRNTFMKVNEAEWDREVAINPWFILKKIKGDMLDMKLEITPDVVYFDAFAPDKEPEMWDPRLFERLYSAMAPDGVLTTYCSKGVIRRLLQQTGYETSRLPGPPGGKREVLRARKPQLPSIPE